MERLIRRIKRSLTDPATRAFWKVMGIIALVLVFDFTRPLSTDLTVRGLSIIGAILVMIMFKVYEIAEMFRDVEKIKGDTGPEGLPGVSGPVGPPGPPASGSSVKPLIVRQERTREDGGKPWPVRYGGLDKDLKE